MIPLLLSYLTSNWSVNPFPKSHHFFLSLPLPSRLSSPKFSFWQLQWPPHWVRASTVNLHTLTTLLWIPVMLRIPSESFAWLARSFITQPCASSLNSSPILFLAPHSSLWQAQNALPLESLPSACIFLQRVAWLISSCCLPKVTHILNCTSFSLSSFTWFYCIYGIYLFCSNIHTFLCLFSYVSSVSRTVIGTVLNKCPLDRWSTVTVSYLLAFWLGLLSSKHCQSHLPKNSDLTCHRTLEWLPNSYNNVSYTSVTWASLSQFLSYSFTIYTVFNWFSLNQLDLKMH